MEQCSNRDHKPNDERRRTDDGRMTDGRRIVSDFDEKANDLFRIDRRHSGGRIAPKFSQHCLPRLADFRNFPFRSQDLLRKFRDSVVRKLPVVRVRIARRDIILNTGSIRILIFHPSHPLLTRCLIVSKTPYV